MAEESSKPSINGKKRKQRYLPHNKPAKKKGAYPLHPGVQGFFITCDGGRELQASREAINIIDSFYEELVSGKVANADVVKHPMKPLNKKIKFTYSDDEEVDCEEEPAKQTGNEATEDEADRNPATKNGDSEVEKHVEDENEATKVDDAEGCGKFQSFPVSGSTSCCVETINSNDIESLNDAGNQKLETTDIATGKKSVDRLIEEELNELGDKTKRLFVNLDSGCNGVVFVQMRKREGDPSPTEVAQHIMKSAASTKKHISRFLLRVIPVEVSCYSSEEEIKKAISPLIAKHFPEDASVPVKFAVLYEARANTGVDRATIINVVAKSVPSPHNVDLTNPEKTIIVEIARTVCLIGVVQNYKELSKYNIRQLTSTKG